MMNNIVRKVLGIGLSLAASAGAVAEKPNVLFILVDDLGYSDIGCYGNSLHETPGIDRLAAEGMRFTDAYAAAAVCSPTRASIQTGRYPIRTGVSDYLPGARMLNTPLAERFTSLHLPDETETIAGALKSRGYQTAFVGKWHLNDTESPAYNPESMGYDVSIASMFIKKTEKKYFAPFGYSGLAEKPDDHYLTDRLGDEAIQLIEQYAGEPDNPFFLMLSFYSVHTPIQPRPDLLEYYEKKITGGTVEHWVNPDYAAMVQCVDENVGRILQALEQHKLDQETLVIFFSDNGGRQPQTSNHPLRSGKTFYYEGGIRVPLIVRLPGRIEAGSQTDVPVTSTDFFPTILDVAGEALLPEAHCDGASFKSVLQGSAEPVHDALYWHYPHYHPLGEDPVSAVRMGDYKLIRHYESGRRELYNLRKDIREEINLMDRMPEKGAELEMKLNDWIDSVNAYVPTDDPEFDPEKPARVRPKKKTSHH